MLKRTLFGLSLCLCFQLWAQESKNEFRLECYGPVVTNGMNAYYNDNWILSYYESELYKRNRQYKNLGFSASYTRYVNKVGLGLRFGILNRYLNENNDFTFVPQEEHLREDYRFNQTHSLISLFMQRTENVKNIELKLGVEIPYIFYGSGTSVYNQYATNLENGVKWTDIHKGFDYKTGSGRATGFGFNIGAAYCFNKKRMKLGLELSDYLLFMKFSKSSIVTGEYTYHFYDPESTSHQKQTYEINSKFQQTAFSNLAPRFYYAICF